MKFGHQMLVAAVATAVAGMAVDASACSTVVVGKNVSATGEIIVGHNEDNDLRIVMSQYWVPAADHKSGEMITYEPAAAKIPQVAHTYGYYWTQTLHPAGYSFSDGFVNEHGVAIVSNNCNKTFEEENPVVDGGVGYGIRRLMAERAKTLPLTRELRPDWDVRILEGVGASIASLSTSTTPAPDGSPVVTDFTLIAKKTA